MVANKDNLIRVHSLPFVVLVNTNALINHEWTPMDEWTRIKTNLIRVHSRPFVV
jgi:hypothetical protein